MFGSGLFVDVCRSLRQVRPEVFVLRSVHLFFLFLDYLEGGIYRPCKSFAAACWTPLLSFKSFYNRVCVMICYLKGGKMSVLNCVRGNMELQVKLCLFWPVEASLLSKTLPACPQINMIIL